MIGANDVANSFATSVSSRSLTMKQAMLVAAVCEFSGSVTVGARVADTIRNKIVEPHHYEDSPGVLLLAMMCTIVGSSLFLTFATRNGMPVSTTHSIIGGIVGTATASIGINKVNWGWDGVSQVFAAWIITPGISGCLGGILFFITKRFFLTRQHAVMRSFYSIPFYTFLTVSALTSMSLVPILVAKILTRPSAHLLEGHSRSRPTPSGGHHRHIHYSLWGRYSPRLVSNALSVD